MMLDISDLAHRQLRDFDARTPGTIFAEQISLNFEQAYAIQSEVCQLREQRGESIVGYKVGCTSPGIQNQLSIKQPIFGRLFANQRWPSGTSLPSNQFAGLAIEGELAVKVSRDISVADVSEAEIIDAIESVFAVIELHNFVVRGKEPSAEELIANNAIHAGFVYATERSQDLNRNPGTLQIEIDNVQVAKVFGQKLISTVVDSLSWLVQDLHRFELYVKAGQTILCGSIANLFPVSGDCQISVKTDSFGVVECAICEHQIKSRSIRE